MTDKSEDEYIEALAAFAENSEPTEIELKSGVEDHRKVYFGQTSNKELKVSHARAAVIYTENLDEHADAAWIGAVGPWYPQYVTWKFKMPAGMTYPALSADEIKALENNSVNFVTNEYKRNYIKMACVLTENLLIPLSAVIGWQKRSAVEFMMCLWIIQSFPTVTMVLRK